MNISNDRDREENKMRIISKPLLKKYILLKDVKNGDTFYFKDSELKDIYIKGSTSYKESFILNLSSGDVKRVSKSNIYEKVIIVKGKFLLE